MLVAFAARVKDPLLSLLPFSKQKGSKSHVYHNTRAAARGRRKGGGGGVLPYMGYIGMCGPKGLAFSAVLVINRVSIFAL